MNDTDQTCGQIRDQLEAYVLGALDPDEHAAVEAHLQHCAECRRLAERAAETLHVLPGALAAASALDLPSSLRERVLQALPLPTSERPARRRWWWRPRGALALAALALAALFAAWNVRLDEAQSQEKELRARVAQLKSLQPVVLEVVDSRHTVKRVLLPPDELAESTAYGKVFTRTDLRDVVVMANRLPQPPAGQAYRLWLTERSGRPRPAGVLAIDKEGFALLVFEADVKNPTYNDARVILQPKGAKTPTGQTALLWNSGA